MNDFFRVFRSFLGLPKFEDHTPDYYEEDEISPRSFDPRLDVFSNMLEKQQDFDRKVSEFFGMTGIFQFGGENKVLEGGYPANGEIEFLDDDVENPFLRAKKNQLREQFLKPGFRGSSHESRIDDEVKGNEDGSKYLDPIYPDNRQERPLFSKRIFGQSISITSVTNPDGSMEIHKTVCDNEGNEETTITRRIGNKEQIIITRRDENGKEEIIDEKDTSRMLRPPDGKPWHLFDGFTRL